MKKGRVICFRFSDGSTQYATVLYVNGSTATVQGADGLIYEIPVDSGSGHFYSVG
jgi:hypothetical protein